ncbi:MAG: actin-binding WH2 domain-containing protein [Anaerolineae bacterium]|nr:actin-binding WH2 domain-containing protein [Anaerolineae bacterium]MCO5190025.1 actin-binding WH2 domain-containing protein [Anaerolineae bacterium]MCO5195404.1 actin-binding WH2 domain-containing protein [Anaerolineae bacterium]MCO5196829.1 actin-binding WH2 domain-containing protein [Anaerolineae bacterium]MCO5207835.1 actin-binding WH2 domain-containing protein [Anaerolineae bacterium]
MNLSGFVRGKERQNRDLAIIETILRDRRVFFGEIRDGIGLGEKMRAMLISSAVFLALYGAVMGSSHSLWQTLSSAFKLPLLFLATLLICAPTLYFFNVLFGSNQSLTQNIALILTAITVTAVLLLAMAPITLFFLLTTSQYQFFKLLNVGVFIIAGVSGVVFLAQGMRIVTSNDDVEGARARRWVLWLWMIVYAFVGSQLAWTIRPFVGAPSIEFELFRQLGGNFYTNIFASLGEVLGFFIVQ